MVKALCDENGDVRCKAVTAMGDLAHARPALAAEALSPVVAALHDANKDVRCQAVLTMG